MPTFEAEERFVLEYRRLRADQQRQFKRALHDFIEVLRSRERERRPGMPVFPAHLGIKPMVSQRRVIMEFRWAPDGRCTWVFGRPRQRQYHVIWRRIGTHEIYEDP